jgi:hypothetical protein
MTPLTIWEGRDLSYILYDTFVHPIYQGVSVYCHKEYILYDTFDYLGGACFVIYPL